MSGVLCLVGSLVPASATLVKRTVVGGHVELRSANVRSSLSPTLGNEGEGEAIV